MLTNFVILLLHDTCLDTSLLLPLDMSQLEMFFLRSSHSPRSYLLQRRAFVVCYLMEMRKRVPGLNNAGPSHKFSHSNLELDLHDMA